MKKIILIGLAVVSSLTLAACSQKTSSSNSSNSSNSNSSGSSGISAAKTEKLPPIINNYYYGNKFYMINADTLQVEKNLGFTQIDVELPNGDKIVEQVSGNKDKIELIDDSGQVIDSKVTDGPYYSPKTKDYYGFYINGINVPYGGYTISSSESANLKKKGWYPLNTQYATDENGEIYNSTTGKKVASSSPDLSSADNGLHFNVSATINTYYSTAGYEVFLDKNFAPLTLPTTLENKVDDYYFSPTNPDIAVLEVNQNGNKKNQSLVLYNFDTQQIITTLLAGDAEDYSVYTAGYNGVFYITNNKTNAVQEVNSTGKVIKTGTINLK